MSPPSKVSGSPRSSTEDWSFCGRAAQGREGVRWMHCNRKGLVARANQLQRGKAALVRVLTSFNSDTALAL